MNSRNTIQKKIILDNIKKTKTHPTASELYEMIKKGNPKIGQATVYRNLKTMANEGDIIIIPGKNNTNRYDGDITLHNHFICEKCGEVTDIFISRDIINNEIENKYGVKIKRENIIYEGICKNCNKNS